MNARRCDSGRGACSHELIPAADVGLEHKLAAQGTGDTGRRFALVIGATALLGMALLVILFFAGRGKLSRQSALSQSAPFGAAEQAYAQRIRFTDIQMSRAGNFLNQEITYISGVVSNDGSRRVLSLDVTVDFRDFSGKIILHETRRVFGGHGAAIEPGQRRDFQLAFESVPDAWNKNYPDLKIAALTFE